MNEPLGERREIYFPAVICAEYDSPIDALVSLRVPRDEAMDLLAAAWADGTAGCVLARLDGGRHVAAIRLPGGRWGACNAFVEQSCATPHEAGRRLEKLVKRGRRGAIGAVQGSGIRKQRILAALRAEKKVKPYAPLPPQRQSRR
ncbi:MAG: hypothetical protein LBC91_01360 [Candidatus Accumulibacter sp.]|jgi:hypothetical protein|nr:hypothetical protein [Accumulibacter sp.]